MSSFAPFAQAESVPVDMTATAVPIPAQSTAPANDEVRRRQRSERHRRSRSGMFYYSLPLVVTILTGQDASPVVCGERSVMKAIHLVEHAPVSV